MKEIESQFQKTTAILFGKPLSGLTLYGGWLLQHVPGRCIMRKSKTSGRDVFVPSLQFFEGMGKNVVTVDEAIPLGERHISEQEAHSLRLANASKLLSQVKTTTPEIIDRQNFGTEQSACYGPTQYCFQVTFCWWSKYIAYSFWSRTSDSLFGCSLLTDCSFCIKCHSSTKLTRCFEVNDSNTCADCYFCHNSENLQDCMFCFNAKGKRYAIGNVEVGREAYVKVKKLVVGSILCELERSHSLCYDIYNVCEGRKKQAN